MRVGVVGPFGPDLFAENLGDALQRAGHLVTQLGPAGAKPHGRLVGGALTLTRQAFPRLDEYGQRKIARAALEAACDVVISVDLRLAPEAVREMSQSGIRSAFWFPDAVSMLGRQLMLLAPYDALFFKEPHIVERLRANLGLPVYYLPQACNPRWHRPVTEPGTEPYLVIAGNMYPSRVKLLDRLISKGIPLRLYGKAFPPWLGPALAREAHRGRYLVREEKARIFRSAAGVVNTMHPAEVRGVNSRLFEAAGCGAAVITEFRPTVPDYFDVGKEVLAFHDFDELVNHANRLLSENGLTGKLGDAATLRAHRDHTIDSRLVTLLEKIS